MIFKSKGKLKKLFNNLNLLLWNAYDSENHFSQKGICVDREILNTYNLLYKPFYFGEDNEFSINLISNNGSPPINSNTIVKDLFTACGKRTHMLKLFKSFKKRQWLRKGKG